MNKKQIVYIHIFYWIVYIINEGLRVSADETYALYFDWNLQGAIAHPNFYYQWYDFFFILIIMVSFYINYFLIIPLLTSSKKIWKVLLGIFSGYLTFSLLRVFIEEVIVYSIFGVHNYNYGVGVGFYLYDQLYYGSYAIIPSIVIWFMIHYVKTQEQNIQILQAKSQAELNFLKMQINPHFLFNTLNNIYSLVYQNSPQSLTAIEKLSSLMRYVTDSSDKETVSLQAELDYIDSYIELESIRFSYVPEFVFSRDIENSNLHIAPFLLITFIENVFKHGDLNQANHPVRISLIQNRSSLVLKVSNMVLLGTKDQRPGIGMENIKKRLLLYYPNKHHLDIEQTTNEYKCELRIDL